MIDASNLTPGVDTISNRRRRQLQQTRLLRRRLR